MALAPPALYCPYTPPIPRPLPPTPRKRREGEKVVGEVFSFPPCGVGAGRPSEARKDGGQGNPLKTLHLLSKVSTDFPLTMHAA